MSAVQDGIADIQAGFEGTGTVGMAWLVTAGQPESKALAKSPASIMKTLNRAAKWSWALISHLLTPIEWSLTGGITLPGLLRQAFLSSSVSCQRLQFRRSYGLTCWTACPRVTVRDRACHRA